MLRKNVLRAPEPVGVPAPQIVVHREVVSRFAYGLVVDAFVRVIAGVGAESAKLPKVMKKLPGIETVPSMKSASPAFKRAPSSQKTGVDLNSVLKGGRTGSPARFSPDTQRVAQRAVGVREAEEKDRHARCRGCR